MPAVLLALVSAVAYGVSDFAGGVASRRVQALRVVLVSYPVSAVVVGVAAPFVGGSPTAASLGWGAASGVLMAVAVWLFYRALAEGPMSIVSPLTAVVVAGLPVLVGIASGERPSALAYVGMVLALGAIVLVTMEAEPVPGKPVRTFTRRVAWLTGTAGCCFALSFVCTARIAAGTGLWPLFVSRATASLVVLVAAVVVGQAALPDARTSRLAVGIGLLDVVANVAMLLAFQTGLLSVVSVLIALYPAVTVGFAVVVLKERIIHLQVAGLALSLVAVAAVAVAS